MKKKPEFRLAWRLQNGKVSLEGSNIKAFQKIVYVRVRRGFIEPLSYLSDHVPYSLVYLCICLLSMTIFNNILFKPK